ncbi:hypothetical protein Jab_1c04960 [Janthinobacterium sp. HH01]|uniref:hypothetical protein n=1 Tax=Janthinobacterium sp. HH01 TaxID=1198452 RepID=UPI0002AE884A|nr:hypothetical protein [Janthinobacterium sp. HH01]ELX11908.1 hypothetical protein Jab_1c04960 [Janthinobacterium sp. HH01]
MATLEIFLPDDLAKEAEEAGLLIPSVLAALVRDGILQLRMNQVFTDVEGQSGSLMTMEDIKTEKRNNSHAPLEWAKQCSEFGEKLHQRRMSRLFSNMEKMAAASGKPLSLEEIQKEVKAVRAEQHADRS